MDREVRDGDVLTCRISWRMKPLLAAAWLFAGLSMAAFAEEDRKPSKPPIAKRL